MAKTTGLGDNFYVAGNDISIDTASLSSIHGGPAAIDVTSIGDSAYERLGGLRDAGMDFVVFHDPTNAHVALSGLPTTDVTMSYFRGTTIGNPAASMVAKQINYDPTRGTDGMLTFQVNAQANAFGLEWGQMLTPGVYITGNSTFEGGTDNWAGGSGVLGAPGNCTPTQTAAQAHGGTKSLQMSSNAGGDMGVSSVNGFANMSTNGFNAYANYSYTVTGWFRSAVSARSCAVGFEWSDANNNHLTSNAQFGSTITDSTSAWTQATATFTPPTGAVYGRIVAEVLATGGASEIHYLDDVVLSSASLTSIDGGASSAFGMQAYLQLMNFDSGGGSDVTISVQDSADNSSFANVTNGSFTQVTAAAAQTQRIATANNATIRRYVQAATATTGGFGHATFAVMFVRNATAGIVF